MNFIPFDQNSYAVDSDPIHQLRQRNFQPQCILDFQRQFAVCSKAIVATDLDDDGNDEICICSLGGELAIYKLSIHTTSHWHCCVCPTKLGTVTCVVSGDVRNRKKKSLVVLTAEGNGYLFEWDSKYLQPIPETQKKAKISSNARADMCIRPCLQFDHPCNVSAALVYKIDDEIQLIIGTTDRKVHSLLFIEDKTIIKYEWNLREQVVGLCGSFEVSNSILGTAEYPIIVAGLQGGIYAKISLHTGLTGVTYFGSNTLNQRKLEKESLRQPVDQDSDDEPSSSLPGYGGGMISFEISRKPHKNTSLTFVGGPLRLPQPAVACGTFEGMLSVQTEGDILWDIFLGHPIFSVHVVDVTGNGKKEIACACWDGMVYIADSERNVVSFQCNEDSICAFCVGTVRTKERKESPILVIAGLSKQIYVYSDFHLDTLYSEPLVSQTKSDFASFNISKDWTKEERIAFIESCCSFSWSDAAAQAKLTELRKKLERATK